MHSTNIDQARLFLYNILSLLLVEEHAKNSTSKIIEHLEVLSQNSFDPDVTEAVNNILTYLKSNSTDDFYKEYEQLFLVPFGNFVSLSASWYYEEREGGTMLVKVRDIIAKTKVRKDENSFKAPEDHYGFIFTLATYLIEQKAKGELDEDLQKELFISVINPYCDLLSQKLMESEMDIYLNVGVIMNNFCNFERTYLDVARPAPVQAQVQL